MIQYSQILLNLCEHGPLRNEKCSSYYLKPKILQENAREKTWNALRIGEMFIPGLDLVFIGFKTLNVDHLLVLRFKFHQFHQHHFHLKELPIETLQKKKLGFFQVSCHCQLEHDGEKFYATCPCKHQTSRRDMLFR